MTNQVKNNKDDNINEVKDDSNTREYIDENNHSDQSTATALSES